MRRGDVPEEGTAAGVSTALIRGGRAHFRVVLKVSSASGPGDLGAAHLLNRNDAGKGPEAAKGSDCGLSSRGQSSLCVGQPGVLGLDRLEEHAGVLETGAARSSATAWV